MSLINEALKKAQGQQQGQGGGTTPPGPPVNPSEPHHPHGPAKGHRRSFIWGFIMAVFIVGTFTTLLATFFVWQFLGDETGDKTTPAPSARVVEEKTVPAEVVESPIPEVDELAKTSPVDVDTTAAKASPANTMESVNTQTVTGTDTSREPPPDKQMEPPAAPPPPQPPNPAIVSRLLELEIRGTLGGSKVLILDQATARTRAYRIGDTLEGSMGLVVEEIKSSSVTFRDYAGYTHTKSF